jgi:fructuronate reductase
MVNRLGRSALAQLVGRGDVRVPAYDPAELPVRVVHLGVGAFHRAHQAVFLEDAVSAAGEGWGICGFTQRSATVRDQLAPQDGLYTVLERGPNAGPPRVVGVMREVRTPAEGPAARIADPEVGLVTLTVTEKGYRFGPTGGLRREDPVIQRDLARAGAADGPPGSVVGQLVAGLARRRRDDAPITLLCCDNLSGNGAALRRLVLEFAAAVDAPLADWIAERCAFPSSVVDRIVPATMPADKAEVAAVLGFDDQGAVVAEPFAQWVIEDAFAAGRPDWPRAGAILTGDVTPYEHAKLRLLNGTHSLLAYTGALAGYDTIAAALADPALHEAAQRLMVDDAGPTLRMPADFDLPAYQAAILARFANRALEYRTVQVALDGSMKLPIRLLSTVRARRAAGAAPRWATLAVAAWMVYVTLSATTGTSRTGKPLPLDDPLADELRAAVSGRTDARSVVDGLLGVRQVFGDDLPADDTVRELLIEHVGGLLGG